MAANQNKTTEKAYQLKIHLVGVSPMVWRRILVHENTSIATLHGILQIVMGWGNEHLHSFNLHGKEYGISYSGGAMFSDDPRSVQLKNFQLRVNEKFLYEYNFYVDWRHQIRVEQILAVEPKKFYPRCIGGKNACPPEGTQGLAGFQAIRDLYQYPMIDFLKIVKFQERLDYPWRPDVFNRRVINSILKKGDYDYIDQFAEVVSIHDSPYYEPKYWYKKDALQGLKRMYEILTARGIEMSEPTDSFLVEDTGMKVYYLFLKEIITSKTEEEGPLTSQEQQYLDLINATLQKL